MGGDIPPPIFLGVLFKDESHPEEVDGRLDTEEKVVEKKGDGESVGFGMIQQGAMQKDLKSSTKKKYMGNHSLAIKHYSYNLIRTRKR